MADGSEMTINLLAKGDLVMDPLTGNGVAVRQVIAGPETIPVVEFALEGKTLRVTQEHPMVIRFAQSKLHPAALTAPGTEHDRALTVPGELRKARDVAVGDELLLTGGKYARVTGIRRELIAATDKVFNFELEAEGAAAKHLVIANGVVTGDLILQKRLATEDSSKNAQ
jgi:hypothetical protein